MFVMFFFVSMLIVSTLGTFMNVYLFWKFLKMNKGGGFLTFCLAKTVPNTVVCSAFLFWVVPITGLSLTYQQLPRLINVFVGQVAGFGAYVAGALIEMFMAVNRFSVIYFPSYSFKNANYIIVFVFMVSMIYVLFGLIPESCGFVFDPDTFLWRPEKTECGALMEDVILYTIYGTFAISNSLNLVTFVKLCFGKAEGISNIEVVRRRRKRIKFFVQSVIQNCLHIIDMINFNFISNLNDALWFKFIFTSLSLLTIHTLDGLAEID
ncbi:Protein CBG11460 [Caenorhabditis briggsae]|uniref:Protein CBG11460 n=1 Tax=Caenorhabditis briggsae TaxID=6238 RepID=A8XCY8_CAEBR|nr:Protein CBG11460 [Caenorhabditis briggsae]CAP30506.2 Protein CBG11460 [Caenorhabditis briggsae]